MYSSLPTLPPHLERNDFEELAAAKAAVMTPHDLQEIIDLADVKFATDGEYLGNWRVQVAEAVAKGARENEEWAIDFLGLTESKR